MCVGRLAVTVSFFFSEAPRFLNSGLAIYFQRTGVAPRSRMTASQAPSPRTCLELEGGLESSLALIKDLEFLLPGPRDGDHPSSLHCWFIERYLLWTNLP